MQKPLTIMLIEPSRIFIDAFRDAVHFSNCFEGFRCALSLENAGRMLIEGQVSDAIFVSYRFADGAIEQFIARVAHACEETAFMQVSRRHVKNAPAAALVKGMHGQLFEPLTVESLQSAADFISEVRSELHGKRMQAGLTLLIKNLLREIDEVAAKRSEGKTREALSQTMSHACRILQSLKGKNLLLCQDVIMNVLTGIAVEAGPAGSKRRRPRNEFLPPSMRQASKQHLLQAAQRNADVIARAEAIMSLGRFGEGGNDLVEALSRFLNDDSSLCRHRAALALMEIGTPEALSAMKQYEHAAA